LQSLLGRYKTNFAVYATGCGNNHLTSATARVNFAVRASISLASQTESWLRFTAREINKRLARHGAFWQSEPFDHLVRSAEQFVYLKGYIAHNPQKANLQKGEYLYWTRVARLSEP
jgi:hypothetical protein